MPQGAADRAHASRVVVAGVDAERRRIRSSRRGGSDGVEPGCEKYRAERHDQHVARDPLGSRAHRGPFPHLRHGNPLGHCVLNRASASPSRRSSHPLRRWSERDLPRSRSSHRGHRECDGGCEFRGHESLASAARDRCVPSTTGVLPRLRQRPMRPRVHGGHLGLEGVEIDPPSTEPRPEDGHVLGDPPRVHRVGIFGELDEVGQLADLERADLVLDEELPVPR